MASPKSILVTGGAGFIGSHVVEDLLANGHRVTVFDNFSSGTPENLAAVRDDVEIVRGDVLDRDAVVAAARGKDVISHQAAQLEITKCMEDPIGDLRTNLIGTLNVLEAARRAGVERMINASSACIYGQAVTRPSDEDAHPHNPNWSYGVSKLAAEKYAQVFSNDYGFPVFSLRYGIVYGPREWYGRVLTIFLKRALDGRPPVVFGDGEQIRDFVFVDDVIGVHRACVETALVGAHSFNAGTGVATSIAELADIVCEVTGIDAAPVREHVAPGERSALVDGRMRLPAELSVMQLSPEKTERVLGVRPATVLRDGLAREWTWLREHPQRWDEMHY
ncbi:MAG: NAD-dependent epimerase/dehydratase family protein [Candidatus Eremiobacteraeota bacterium]|nr:NAD-dependent epimerase/dehydratase family protein [Candidatus Eremiobacteraeota bacterium]